MEPVAYEHCQAKMQQQGISELAMAQFERLYRTWSDGDVGGYIREADVTALHDVPTFQEIRESMDMDFALEAFAHTAFIKLNGGLGTSMGLEQAKSLLPIRRHKARQMSFLDIILGQVITARKRQGVTLPLTLMNSFRTSADSMRVVHRNKHFDQGDIPLEIIQHTEPKIDAQTGEPIDYPTNPELEWCPPGHGDLFSTIWETGLLDKLEAAGIAYIFISNSDNLGARPSRTLAGHFAKSGSPFMIEVAQRTEADRKGGHLVVDKESGRLILREMTQVDPRDKSAAMSIRRHPYFNTNSIWVRVDALKTKLKEYQGILPLPVIVNRKTVDPADDSTPAVIQLETAMGAAVSLFEGASCVKVDRMRFLPVKTTDDLFIMRSDRFHLTDAYEMEDGNYIFPNVSLDQRYYKNIADFNDRFPYGVPALAAANSVSIEGDWTFGRDVALYANAHLPDLGKPSYVPNGQFVGPQGVEPDDWM
ncbi:UTP--glucose-1-phosphate uridylyltransferase [Bombiscardovia nodaiensis]|uniref:UTP--glucose-1-phosphate uridylyltransferase n=1 Tax=Bombiscardovia nodaiensis TaxID=2932181 RepID=A0ABN6SA14_9BIFI|nr:UTP--glucose-1-phosphate uridylyltransferase [Bombiscardovia nodaiensis]